jgi:hypothetical protein
MPSRQGALRNTGAARRYSLLTIADEYQETMRAPSW